ncbi:putative polyketide synthase [Trichinella pseudospiralis]
MQQTTSARNPSYFDYCLITSAPKPYCILTVKIGVLWCERFERLLYCASVHVRFFEKINEYESAVVLLPEDKGLVNSNRYIGRPRILRRLPMDDSI